jgi:nitrite reductase/ring-hydroxylating ferredoxin subunit
VGEFKLCRIDSIGEGDPRRFFVAETELLVVNVGGTYYCLAARCTHAGAPLEEGEVSGDILTCPWHASQFRITDGMVLRGPAEKPLKVYASMVKGEYLYVQI